MSPRIFEIPADLPNCPRCGVPIRLAARTGESAYVEPCGHYIEPSALRPAHVDESDATAERRLATDGGSALICDVKGCETPAAVRVYPTNGRTNHAALRCWDCLDSDRSRDHFNEWRRAIERDRLEPDGGVIAYDCPEHGEINECNVDDVGQRRCPDCGSAVTAIVTDGGLVTCPECNGRGEVVGCVDDLCHAQGECIHDGNDTCHFCGGAGRYHPDDVVQCEHPDCERDAGVREPDIHEYYCSWEHAEEVREGNVDRGESVETDGGRDEDDESVVMNPDDAAEIAGHFEHEGFNATRVGAGELVDIHISCDECSIRYIIEDVPKDKAENPGKYTDDGGESA